MLLEVAKYVAINTFLHFELSCSICECNDSRPHFRGLALAQQESDAQGVNMGACNMNNAYIHINELSSFRCFISSKLRMWRSTSIPGYQNEELLVFFFFIFFNFVNWYGILCMLPYVSWTPAIKNHYYIIITWLLAGIFMYGAAYIRLASRSQAKFQNNRNWVHSVFHAQPQLRRARHPSICH